MIFDDNFVNLQGYIYPLNEIKEMNEDDLKEFLLNVFNSGWEEGFFQGVCIH